MIRFLPLLVLLAAIAVRAAPVEFERGMEALVAGNYAEAYCRWKPLAERGYTEAQYNLGWLYANGNGMNVDIKGAVAWWQRAAEQGHADAQFALGFAYTTGEGIGKDNEKAITWFLKAARQGHRDAREILEKLAADPKRKALDLYPGLAGEAWFGRAALIKGERVNLRGGPGTQFKIVAKLPGKTPVRALRGPAGWNLVLFTQDGKPTHAWVFHTLVEISSTH